MKLYKHHTSIVDIPAQTTEYILGSDLMANVHNLLAEKNVSSFLVLTDESVLKLFGNNFISSLKKLRKPIVVSAIKPGEKQKDITKIPEIVAPFFAKGFDRKSCLIALGGGVVTDLGGFIASVLLRGISCVYVPTTLLAQIDAAIGGKTGVDFWLPNGNMYKNMLGTITQPEVVISDIDVLKTLPERELKSGLGEMTKYWVGWGEPNFKLYGNSLTSLAPSLAPLGWNQLDTLSIMKIVSTCQKMKLDLIQKDPFDTLGLREKLNLGHTFGHALESAADSKLSHGEAVALGLVAASKISALKGLLQETTRNKIINAIQSLGFAITIKGLDKNRVLNTLAFDKKGGKFVLVKDIGSILTQQTVEAQLIKKVLEEIIL